MNNRGINRADYFGGAIINYLLSNKISKSTPILCDESRDNKSLSFLTDNGEYNLYIKYSTNFNVDEKGNRKCTFKFTEGELNKIKQYATEKSNLYVTLICTNESLNGTEIAFVPVDKALCILGFDNVNVEKLMHVKHLKRKHSLNIWGTMLDENKSVKIKKDFNWIFEKEIPNEVA